MNWEKFSAPSSGVDSSTRTRRGASQGVQIVMARRIGFASIVLTFLVTMAVAAAAESHVRIVRLSNVEGSVQMDRATGQGLERAILNTPIVQGTRIVTGDGGLAEVEFEDQSTLRLAGNSEVTFRKLLINDAGSKVNDIEAAKGILYFDTHSKGQDIYRIAAQGSSFVVRPDSQARFKIAPDQLQLAVFKGTALLENPQVVEVKKKESLSLDPQGTAAPQLAKSVEILPEDAWNKERAAYSQAYAYNAGYGGPRSGYGLQDLNYYGNYIYAPGYGYAWQPFGFAGMSGWDPYSNGAWMFSPGMGYTWASAYPWGWLPYHYGSWAFINGVGWAWLPGSGYHGGWYYNNFQSASIIAVSPTGWQPIARPPKTPAQPATAHTILVGKAVGAPNVAGGRVQPDFGSVIPGRRPAPAALSSGFAAPSVRSATAIPGRPAGFAQVSHNGHVFVPPTHIAGPMGVGAVGPVTTGPRVIGSGTQPVATGGHATATGHGASGTAHR